MKELTMFIRPEKLEVVKKILVDQYESGGMTVINAMGCGNQKGFGDEFKGTRTNVNLLPKLKIEVFVQDDKVEGIINDITSHVGTGHFGDGKIFIKNVEDAVRIRTGERGDAVV